MFLKSFSQTLLTVALTFVALQTLAPIARAQSQCQKPFVFFDLGGTIVDTDTNNYNPNFYYPGAYQYLSTLISLGHQPGLMIDVPESWGRDTQELKSIKDYPTAKWMRVLQFLAGQIPTDKTSWKGKAFEPRFFGNFSGKGADVQFEGRVVLPMKDSERKETGNPIVFVRALALADKVGCDAIFMGEDPEQIKMAESVGMIPYQVGVKGRPFYLPANKIAEYIEEFKAQKLASRAENAARASRSSRAFSRPARSGGFPLR